jgi:nitroreductase
VILELMKDTRSICNFKPEPIPEEILLKLADAAASAPSAGDKQPWKFLLVKSREIIENAAKELEKECTELSKHLRPVFHDDFSRSSEDFAKFGSAPALIVPLFRVFSGLSSMVSNDCEKRKEIDFLCFLEHHTALVGVSLAIQNIFLMAKSLGMGACSMTSPLIAEHRLEKCFRVPSGWRIASIIAVGYPKAAPSGPGRKPLNTMIRWR